MNPSYEEDFGSLLRLFRLRARLTQEELATQAGVGKRTIQDLERGINNPRIETLKALVDALKLQRADRAAFVAAAVPGESGDTTRSGQRKITAGTFFVPMRLPPHYVE